MSTVAILAALAAAASWAIASVAISRLLEHGHVSPAAANLFKNGLAGFCFFVAALIVGGRWPVGDAWAWLFISGFLGFAVADTLYFAAFRRCGVQTAATIVLLNVPIATLLAVPLAGDAIQTQVLPFMLVVLVGVVLVIVDSRIGRGGDPGGPASRASYLLGILLALGAALAIGTAVPIGRGRFDEVGVCPGGFIRLFGGALGAFPVALLSGLSRGTSPTREVIRLIQPLLVAPGPASVWGRASVIGVGCAIVGLLPYHYALRELPGGISAVLFSSTPLFTLPLAILIGQRAGWVGVVGTIVGFAGVAGILLGDRRDERIDDLRLEVTRLAVASPVSARFPTFVEGARSAGLPPVLVTAEGLADNANLFRIVLLGDDDPSARRERTVDVEDEGESNGVGRYFVNWADVPRAARLATGALLVATLERLGDSTYAYGVRLSLEEDGPPGRDIGWLHDDQAAVEHGFVSLVPEFDGGALAVWLDGRAGSTHGGGADTSAEGVPSGMQLRARSVGANGGRSEEQLLDGLVCDCCPTDAVTLDDGTVVVVYRDRTEDELRDIWYVRREAGSQRWSDPVPVHRDGWKMPGCPVNGPAVAAAGDVVAVAWYTQGGRAAVPEVRVAFSTDRGRSFAKPRTVALGGTLGRVDLASAGGRRFVLSHLAVSRDGEEGADGPSAGWDVALVTPGAEPAESVRVTDIDPGRRSGRLELAAAPVPEDGPERGRVHAIWTSGQGVHAARIDVLRMDSSASKDDPDLPD